MGTLRAAFACAILVLDMACTPLRQAPPPVAKPRWAPLTQEALVGSWELTHVGSDLVPRNIGLRFSAYGSLHGGLTCGNLLRGAYQVRPNRIAFLHANTTERGCDSHALLDHAEKVLLGHASAYFSADREKLYWQGPGTLLTFRRVPEAGSRADAQPVAPSVPADPGLPNLVGISLAPGGPPVITLRTPTNWTHEFEAGDDTRRHVVAGSEARVMLEFWTHEPTWACREASCGLSTLEVNRTAVPMLKPPRGGGFSAFIPRLHDNGRGISIIATCHSREACEIAEKVAASVRIF